MGLVHDALILFLMALGLYTLTLAPTVTWGDGAHLQLKAVRGTLNASAGGHPLWVWISHQFTKIPLGDIAGRVNFVSALFGATTIGLAYLIMREIGLDGKPSVVASVALMVSHTFWSYSVRAEVYTLALTMMALQAWLGLRWFRTGRQLYLAGSAFVLGLGLAAHLMVVLYLPALGWLLWRRREELGSGDVAASLAASAVAVVPLIALVTRDVQVYDMEGEQIVRWALFSFEGYDFSSAFLDFSPALLPSDLFEWLAFLGIQFLGVSAICGLVGFWKSWQMLEETRAVYLLLLYVGALLFSFAYRVGDRYVFYLPSYLPFIAWAGVGCQWVMERWGRGEGAILQTARLYGLLVLLVVIVPVAAYRVAPEVVARGITFRDTRRVPGAGGKYFFLWPPKTGYDDARVYAEEALKAAPENSVLLADPTLQAPIAFLQAVEGIRPDVKVRYCCWAIEDELRGAAAQPVALADDAPQVYPIGELRRDYDIRRRGPIYLLEKANR